MGWFSGLTKSQRPAGTPEASPGGPVADPSYHPADAEEIATQAVRLQVQTGFHLFGDGSAAARAYSNTYQSTPSRTALSMMGLADQARAIDAAVQRTNDLPFPGVPLGAPPSFSAAPDTSPITPDFDALHYSAHRRVAAAATRRRILAG